MQATDLYFMIFYKLNLFSLNLEIKNCIQFQPDGKTLCRADSTAEVESFRQDTIDVVDVPRTIPE